MKHKALFIIVISIISTTIASTPPIHKISNSKTFNIQKDLLLANFDCKTDVDDLHTVAAFAMLLSDPKFSKLKYHAVAGTYGIQKGLYVPPNDLFQLVFENNWTDAHENLDKAVDKVKKIATETLKNKGTIWIAEAGQSDFTAMLIKTLQTELPQINIIQHIKVVQHSDWNEKSTAPEHLEFVKENATYYKIADGNAEGNGTPGFRNPEYKNWKDKITNPKMIEIWQLAIDLSNKYNGKDGRYNNKAISNGGLDFSDLSEVCWILGIEDIKNVKDFFNTYSN